MAEFFYTARTPEGKLTRERIRMKDEKALSEYLKNKGLILTSAKALDSQGKFSMSGLMNRMSRVPLVQKIFFTQNLSIMVKTGFSLAQALKTIGAQLTNKRFQQVVNDLQQDVENGISFSNSLAKYPKVFPEIFVNMVAAGEASGKLDEILINLTKQMKKDHSIISKVRSAMSYPVIVVFAMGAIGTIMMITVVPQLVGIFQEANLQLPLTTRILIAISSALTNYGIWIGLGIVGLGFLFIRARKTQKGKRILHYVFLRLPIMSTIIKKINLARFTRTLSSLLKTDIPIVQTLQIISKTLGNIYYQQAMIDASEKVKKGITIVKSLEEQPKLFPAIVTQMINIGEESGTLDSISEEIANFYEEDVDQTMNNLSTIIEPVLMLVIGAVVAVLALSILQPMYGLVQAV